MKAHPIADLFPLLAGEEFEALVASMRDQGFDGTHPVITYQGQILDGRNRHRAAEAAQVTPVYREWTGGDPWDFVWRENAVRRHLEQGQKAALRWKFTAGSDEHLREQEKLRQEANAARSSTQAGQPKNVVRHMAKDVHPEKHEHVRLAAAAGVSPRTAARAIELEKKDPEAFEAVARGEVTLSEALGQTKLKAKRALAEEIRANPVVTPDGRYQVIAIDPPWRYDTRADDVSHRGKNPYPDMSAEEICALPVTDLAQEDCVLWLWTTNAFMRDAYRCLDAWGFKEKTILTWDKERIGLGDWLRNVTEHCILAVRGAPVVSLISQTTLIRERRREHSRKPDAFYSLVESLCPGSRLEMFSRSNRDGWTVWGAEAGTL